MFSRSLLGVSRSTSNNVHALFRTTYKVIYFPNTIQLIYAVPGEWT